MGAVIRPVDYADDLANSYFRSYEDLEVHRLMLLDGPRVAVYREAIMHRRDLIEGRSVMDVGAGSGILSVLCAQAGARRVIAVEASDLATLAVDVVKENNFENVIQVFHSKVEDLVLPNNEKVDIIVSEWMGFYLLHEGMLDSVIYARDHFLYPDGHMFPESASISAAPCRVPSLFESWSDVHGVSMNCFAERLRQVAGCKPEVMIIPSSDIIAEPQVISWIDLRTVTKEELHLLSAQTISVSKERALYQGLCMWFTCQFPAKPEDEKVIELSTSPYDAPTHWKQTVIVLPEVRWLEPSEPMAWDLRIKRNRDPRKYNLELTLLDPDVIEHPLPCNCWRTTCILAKRHLEDMQQNV